MTTIVRDELQHLIADADSAYDRYRRLVINPTPDGKQPPLSHMSGDQLAATLELETAEARLESYRAERAERRFLFSL